MKRPAAALMVMMLVAIAIGVSVAQPAASDPTCEGGVTVSYNNNRGQVVQRLRCPGNAPTAGKATTSKKESRSCHAPSGKTVPCSTANGNWNSERSCYSQDHSGGITAVEAPQGDQIGTVMQCTTLTGSAFLYLVPPDTTPPPDPRQLAQTAISRMNLSAPQIGSFPWTIEKSRESLGVVGFNTWLWITPTPTTYGPITKSATTAGHTVSATAKVTNITWNLGNGDTIQCGQGTPYPTHTRQPNPKSPDCGYTYTKDGHYTLTATANWQITWTGIGQTGTIPMQLTTTGNLAIAEIQVLNTTTSNN